MYSLIDESYCHGPIERTVVCQERDERGVFMSSRTGHQLSAKPCIEKVSVSSSMRSAERLSVICARRGDPF